MEVFSDLALLDGTRSTVDEEEGEQDGEDNYMGQAAPSVGCKWIRLRQVVVYVQPMMPAPVTMYSHSLILMTVPAGRWHVLSVPQLCY